MNALELLQSLNLLDENERIEAKRAQEVGKSLLETICAFANEPNLGGGWLLLGVTREELALFPGYEVEGTGRRPAGTAGSRVGHVVQAHRKADWAVSGAIRGSGGDIQ